METSPMAVASPRSPSDFNLSAFGAYDIRLEITGSSCDKYPGQ